MTGAAIRVLLADDQPLVREGLCRILDRETDLDVVGEAADGEQAVDLARRLLPDVAVPVTRTSTSRPASRT